jgi:hypothetical protein
MLAAVQTNEVKTKSNIPSLFLPMWNEDVSLSTAYSELLKRLFPANEKQFPWSLW